MQGLLSEAQRHLFHSTELSALLGILHSNALRFTYSDGTYAEDSMSKGYPFYLSTSREKFGGYARIPADRCELVLDGHKLERTGKVKFASVDYWGGMGKGPSADAETEERLLSHEQLLPNAAKYIDEVHVYLYRDIEDFDFRFVKTLKKIIELSIERSVPIFFYVRAAMKSAYDLYKMQRSDRAMSVKNLWDFLKQHKLDNLPNDNVTYDRTPSRTEDKDRSSIKILADMINRPEEYTRSSDDMTEGEYYVYRAVLDGSSSMSYISSWIHNNRIKEWTEFTQLAKSIRSNGYQNLSTAVGITRFLILVGRVVKIGVNDMKEVNRESIYKLKDDIADAFYSYAYSNKHVYANQKTLSRAFIEDVVAFKIHNPTAEMSNAKLREFLLKIRKSMVG